MVCVQPAPLLCRARSCFRNTSSCSGKTLLSTQLQHRTTQRAAAPFPPSALPRAATGPRPASLLIQALRSRLATAGSQEGCAEAEDISDSSGNPHLSSMQRFFHSLEVKALQGKVNPNYSRAQQICTAVTDGPFCCGVLSCPLQLYTNQHQPPTALPRARAGHPSGLRKGTAHLWSVEVNG